jgi:hypothetical protein
MAELGVTEYGALRQKGGDTEGGRLLQIQANAQSCAVREAIQRARRQANPCCDTTPVSRRQVPVESTYLEGKILQCYQIDTAQATRLANQSLRGVPESVRIAQRMQETNQEFANPENPSRRFIEYRGPQVATVCPPIPTEITNANLPKPSTRCDTLNLLATGVPPNSIPSANR